RFLAQHADALELHLLTLRGGTVRNAIAREAFATFAIPRTQQNKLAEQVEQFARTLKSELELVEENLLVKLVDETAPTPLQVIEAQAQQRIIAMLNACPNGVHRMSDSTPRIVETSSNIGIVACENNQLTTLVLIRSQSDSGRHYVESMFHSLAKLSGAQVEVSGGYPGWKPDPSSKIMKIFQKTYQDLYGRTPNIMVIHAGLECGLFKKPYPNMDMLSFGPTIKFPHSPDEKVNIHSVELFWQQMRAILTQIPKKEA
ncbi:MAG: M20/M25/M40 family metallo-hydrolase, partial [Vibrionaceae bacterium]